MSRLRIAAIRLSCANPRRSAAFYAAAFGCSAVPWLPARRAAGRHTDRRVDRGSASTMLRLGRQSIELVPTRRPGLAVAASDATSFQHFAIIVADMGSAMRRLQRVPGWRPLSRAGPETLPAESGGVVAFKFTDPDGHPLELLAYPDDAVPGVWRREMVRPGSGTCLGIDHSAITVTDTDRSIGFWRRLGFAVTERHVNRGIEQERLDDVEDARVEVTGLRPPGGAPPHLELLCYREPGTRTVRLPAGDRLATRTVLASVAGDAHGPAERTARDPDGHHLIFRR